MNDETRQKTLEKILQLRIQAASNVLPGETRPELAVVAVFSAFSFQAYIGALLQLHKRLGTEEKQFWKAGYTKMYFLLGNPTRIVEKDPDAFIYRESGVALTGLLSPAKAKGFRSMCPQYGNTNVNRDGYEYFGHWRKYLIEITTECSTIERMLVDVSHIINESLIEGRMNALSSVSVRFRDYVKKPFVNSKALYTRVLFDAATKQYKVRGQLYEA